MRNAACSSGSSSAWFRERAAAEKKRIEAARENEERARLAAIRRELETTRSKAAAELEGARQIAGAMPRQLTAVRAAEQQATARYQAGLGTISEVAAAQQLRTQAEIDDALARLGIWRALLGIAVAEGDLRPFLEAAR